MIFALSIFLKYIQADFPYIYSNLFDLSLGNFVDLGPFLVMKTNQTHMIKQELKHKMMFEFQITEFPQPGNFHISTIAYVIIICLISFTLDKLKKEKAEASFLATFSSQSAFL